MATQRRLVTVGEALGLFSTSRIGRYALDPSFSFGIGGAESNVAIGAARLGAAVTWIGRVGSDSTGDHIEQVLIGEGIQTIAIRDPGFTGLMVRHDRFAGTSHVDYHREGSAGSRLCSSDLPADHVRAAEILHLTGITAAISTSARSAVFEAAEIAKDAGVVVSFDINYRRKLWAPDEAAPVLKDLIAHSDIVFAGREESNLVTGESATTGDDAAEHLAGLGLPEVIVKDGAHGCFAIIDGKTYRLPAKPVTVIDPVGAGDAFVAGYLADRLLDARVEDRLSTAIQVAALAVSAPGDCENLPNRSDLTTASANDVIR